MTIMFYQLNSCLAYNGYEELITIPLIRSGLERFSFVLGKLTMHSGFNFIYVLIVFSIESQEFEIHSC